MNERSDGWQHSTAIAKNVRATQPHHTNHLTFARFGYRANAQPNNNTDIKVWAAMRHITYQNRHIGEHSNANCTLCCWFIW